jgi:hypothetical protein
MGNYEGNWGPLEWRKFWVLSKNIGKSVVTDWRKIAFFQQKHKKMTRFSLLASATNDLGEDDDELAGDLHHQQFLSKAKMDKPNLSPFKITHQGLTQF